MTYFMRWFFLTTNGNNIVDWICSLRMTLRNTKKLYVLDAPISWDDNKDSEKYSSSMNDDNSVKNSMLTYMGGLALRIFIRFHQHHHQHLFRNCCVGNELDLTFTCTFVARSWLLRSWTNFFVFCICNPTYTNTIEFRME